MNPQVEKLGKLADDLARTERENDEALSRECDIAERLAALRRDVKAKYERVSEGGAV